MWEHFIAFLRHILTVEIDSIFKAQTKKGVFGSKPTKRHEPPSRRTTRREVIEFSADASPCGSGAHTADKYAGDRGTKGL